MYLSDKEGWKPVPKSSDFYYEKPQIDYDDYFYNTDYDYYNSIYSDWPVSTTTSPAILWVHLAKL